MNLAIRLGRDAALDWADASVAVEVANCDKDRRVVTVHTTHWVIVFKELIISVEQSRQHSSSEVWIGSHRVITELKFIIVNVCAAFQQHLTRATGFLLSDLSKRSWGSDHLQRLGIDLRDHPIRVNTAFNASSEESRSVDKANRDLSSLIVNFGNHHLGTASIH